MQIFNPTLLVEVEEIMWLSYISNLQAIQKGYINSSQGFASSRCCTATVIFFIPSAGVHRRTGEQIFRTFRLWDAPGEARIRFLGSAQRDCSTIFTTARPLFKSSDATYRRQRRRLLHSVHTNVIVPLAPFIFPKVMTQYVYCCLIYFLIIFLVCLATSMIGLFMLVLFMFMIYLF